MLREILKEGSYIGHSALLLFALRFHRRPYIWEGESRKDLLAIYMPWALERCLEPCAYDGAACILREDAGLFASFTEQDLLPCTEEHPLHEVRHWVAAVAVEHTCGAGADPLN